MNNIKDNYKTNRIQHIPPETVSFLHILKESLGSFSTFFSVGYAILLILSITYNLGYFKNINPQFIELIGISDYINDTLDNLWFFIIFMSLIFSSSLGATRKHSDTQFSTVITTAGIVLLLTLYIMFKGGLENKFFYILRSIVPNALVFYILVSVVLTLVISLSIFAYRFSYSFANRRMPKYTPSMVCIFVFVLIVLIPYALGISKSYYEKELITKQDIRIHFVDILTTNNGQILKGVYIIKELDKGVIINEYTGKEPSESNFVFIHWNDIKRIYYKDFATQPQ